MNIRKKIFPRLLLASLSKVYGCAVYVRNKLFDWGILKQEQFDVPVVVVGNIAAGGTGKTPHTEYIVDYLKRNYNIAVLSRGYKRSTKGFVLASNSSTESEIGDEPYQMLKKFGNCIKLAVCEDRCHGIKELLKIYPEINLVVLDDAFQHRYVKPTVAVVLMEYNRPVYSDNLLPLGHLRESHHALNRADMVIVTKCPEDIKPMDFRIIKNNLNLFPSQKLFFSTYEYGDLVSVFPENSMYIPYLEWLKKEDSILAIAGIANPKPFVKYLKKFAPAVKVMNFPDHHKFTKADMAKIENRYKHLPGRRKIIITTEKDAVRFSGSKLFPEYLKPNSFYLPVKVNFLQYFDMNFENELIKDISRQVKGELKI